MNVFGFENSVMSIVFLVLLAVKVFAFVDAATRRADAYPAAGKMTKPAWLLILGLAAACVRPSLGSTLLSSPVWWRPSSTCSTYARLWSRSRSPLTL